MDRDANYVAVGAFVLLLLAMATAFVLWYSETGDRRSYQRYEIYFDGSVFGLSQGGSVRYLGVSVGRVTRIQLDPRDASRVRIVADISEDTPIKGDTVASLALQGVTGLLFIDLKPADPGKVRTQPVPSIQYPVIPSERSDFDVFVSSLPDAVAKASEVLNRLNATLSDNNIKAITNALGGVEAAAAELPGTVTDTRKLLAELQTAAAEMRAAATEARSLAGDTGPELQLAIKSMRKAAENAAAMTARLDRLVADNQESVSRFAGEGLGDIQAMTREVREAAQSIQQMSRQIKSDPSQLLYQPATRGVEIPP
jgi:phospholipid/cholesterol/gamma-HCH transport system substrate-binding protein